MRIEPGTTVVVGGQYGSEGKGVIVTHLAERFPFHVRVGGPNAGHSFHWRGAEFKMQAIPCGWTNLRATLWLGPNAIISPAILATELAIVRREDPQIDYRLFIDPRATVLMEDHHSITYLSRARSDNSGQGIGAARCGKISRGSLTYWLSFGEWCGLQTSTDDHIPLAIDVANLKAPMRHIEDSLINMARNGVRVMVEGTQGFGLSMTHGEWPYVTSWDTTASQMLADIGLPPQVVQDVIMVVRTHPIRVSGQSGPLPGELTWEEIGERAGRPVIEHTTVTRKVRRIGEFDIQMVKRAALINGATCVALNFTDYLGIENLGVQDKAKLNMAAWGLIDQIERACQIPVRFIGTGRKTEFESFTVIEREDV